MHKHLILLLFLGCSAPVWQNVELAKRQGKPEAAIEVIKSHLQNHPRDARAYFELGELYARAEQYQNMLEAYQECQKLDDRWEKDIQAAIDYHWTKNFNTGLNYFITNRHQQAVRYFKHATTINPDMAISQRLYGEALWATGDSTGAQQALERVLQLNSSDERARRLLLQVYFTTGSFREAIEQAELILSVYPEDIEALRMLAYSLDQINETARAESIYQKLTHITPSPADIETYAAFLYRNGKYSEAAAMLLTAIRKGGSRLKNLFSLAQCRLMQLDYRELQQTAQDILELRKDDLTALQLLQISYAGIGESEKANIIQKKIYRLTSKR